jgi:hypothetical protein
MCAVRLTLECKKYININTSHVGETIPYKLNTDFVHVRKSHNSKHAKNEQRNDFGFPREFLRAYRSVGWEAPESTPIIIIDTIVIVSPTGRYYPNTFSDSIRVRTDSIR